jgi:hypothetical protein
MRKKSIKQVKTHIDDAPSPRPTAAELAIQVGALKDGMQDVQKQLDTQFQRIAAIQAQVDHLAAKSSNR